MTSAHRYHDISAGHRVVGHEGKCKNLHGHNYRIHLTCMSNITERAGESELTGLDELGRVIDFTELKLRICTWLEDYWDHRMILWDKDPQLAELKTLDRTITTVPFNPTAENLARYLVKTVGPLVLKGTNVRLVTCTIDETRKCSATYSILKSVIYQEELLADAVNGLRITF